MGVSALGSPQIIVMAGPNGAGKSTAAARLVRPSTPYINADEIAKTLPGYPSSGADMLAGRIKLEQMDEQERRRETFAVETTLAGRTLAPRIRRLRADGRRFRLIFVWTPSAEVSIHRVRARVRAGGHNIPEATIRRRHTLGIKNFFGLCRSLADDWFVYNCTGPSPALIASGRLDEVERVADRDSWDMMTEVRDDG